MDKTLEMAIVGKPIMAKLGDREYEVAFPIQAVILYKAETAEIDRKRAQGRAKLTSEERKALRQRRLDILRESEQYRPEKDKDWESEKFVAFQALSEEATALKIQLDEDSARGDSLYDLSTWDKIGPLIDPERMLVALWVGTHSFDSGEFKPQIAKPDISRFINYRNAPDLTEAIMRALAKDLIPPEELHLKNVPAPVTPAPTKSPETVEMPNPSLPVASGPSLVST